jgi:hypothetical protein
MRRRVSAGSIIGAAVRFPGHQGDDGLSERVHELRAATDHSVPLLGDARKIARHVDQDEKRLLAITPTVRPPIRPSPTTMLGAHFSCSSRRSYHSQRRRLWP